MKFLLTALPFVFIGGQAQANLARSASLTPVDPVGDVVAIQAPNKDTRIFYQPRSGGGIAHLCVDSSFKDGLLTCDATIVPPTEVRDGTPIAAVTLNADNNGFTENRVFFVSPDNILSEYLFTTADHGRSGPNCPKCITHNGFPVVNGSQVLYAMANPSAPGVRVRVGFVSTASPDTITEASLNANGQWTLAVMP
ncbi:hypothetical protein D9758_005444 [Tetrapyrgos nigripes]|uniref:Uncharacterized protein n=1 Tax=Tetrapyrgos nigripes TaxID=182062 RepID=A0A8H5LPW4_9AGAR|nr:hypothetical protein D9758_005444 [Tetrapyrgos nigripes]